MPSWSTIFRPAAFIPVSLLLAVLALGCGGDQAPGDLRGCYADEAGGEARLRITEDEESYYAAIQEQDGWTERMKMVPASEKQLEGVFGDEWQAVEESLIHAGGNMLGLFRISRSQMKSEESKNFPSQHVGVVGLPVPRPLYEVSCP